MRDYELTIQEMNDQLAEKDSLTSKLKAEIEREKGRSSSLQDQLTHLTTQETTERERAEKMKVSYNEIDSHIPISANQLNATLYLDMISINKL